MITVSFPDHSKKSYPKGITPAHIAAEISNSLAKKAVAAKINHVPEDLSTPITENITLEIITRDHPDALELIRHDCAHIMAEAIQKLFPETKVTIGPVIKNGFYYDFDREIPFNPDDFSAIEEEMRHIIAKNTPFTKHIISRDEARKIFSEKNETYKLELIDAIPEDQDIKIYRQGEWFDLCRGPHMVSTGQAGNAFKILKIAGAYWRGDPKKPMLQRLYATAFRNEKELKHYLNELEEAEKRDHRRLGREMNLYHFQEEAPGSVFWHEKGWRLFQTLIAYMRRRQNQVGYQEVNSPDLMEKKLWEESGHWEKFGDHMFTSQTPDERIFALKPMNCPGHVQIFKNGLKSYRNLPVKISEFGKVHRYEPSGALHGLLRVRSFTQDDAHIFCSEKQITKECVDVHKLMMSIYEDFGFTDVRIKFSDRPEKRVGEDHIWDKSETALKEAVEAAGGDYELNPGEGAFYGPKLEYILRDAIGREWQCGTLQVDLNLPARLGAFYIDSDGEKTTPVMLHRAMFGSLERFAGILIEHHAGKLPMWLTPIHCVIATITDAANQYAGHIGQKCQKAGLFVETDLRNEKINYKIRDHSLAKIPLIMVVGQKEVENNTVTVRRLGVKEQKTLQLQDAIEQIVQETQPPG